ncbi:MAG: DUF6472 family protein [Lachnospiraceae bacterium]|nr:DUF6472 family protein [Lachnospiraceae bacterium]
MICDTCAYLEYDEDLEDYICSVDMDEDDYARLMNSMGGREKNCPYYTNGDEYQVVKHQM